MKTIVTVVVSLYIASALSMKAADPKTNWANNCAQCHGPSGKGDTKMGKMLNAMDLTDPKKFKPPSLMRKLPQQSKTALSRTAKRQ